MAVVTWRSSGRHRRRTPSAWGVAATGSLVALGCTAALAGIHPVASQPTEPGQELVASAPVLVALQSGAVAEQVVASKTRLTVARGHQPGRSSSARKPVRHTNTPPAAPTTVSGLPVPALRAYKHATAVTRSTSPSCGLEWYVLAGIGMAESDHGRVGDSEIASDGRSLPRILGPLLDGRGDVAAIPDSDGGRLDADKVWDRAVGPMQFIPQTWQTMAADGDGDGVRDPNDLDDAALAAGSYLCRSGGNLGDESALAAAIRNYNNSREYVLLVMAYADAYRRGAYPTVPADLLAHLGGPDAPVTPEPDDQGRDHKPDNADKPRHPHRSPHGNGHGDRPSRPGGGSPHHGGTGGNGGGGSPHQQPKPPKPEPPKPPKPPKPEPPNPPKPVIKIVVLTGVPTACNGEWCVSETYAGDLAAWSEVADYDGDCSQEAMTQELRGLSASGTSVQVTVKQTRVDGEVTATVTKAFEVIDGPVCEDAPESTPAPQD